MICFFVPGVILDCFAYPESIFRGRKSKILHFFTKYFFDQKLIFYIKNNSWTKKNRKSTKKSTKNPEMFRNFFRKFPGRRHGRRPILK